MLFKKMLLSLSLAAALGTGAFITAHARQRDGDGMMEGGRRMGRMMRLEPQERAAFLDSRLAAVRAGLQLTADQEKLWPAVENVARENAKIMGGMLDKAKAAGRPADPVEGMRRMADMATARGEGLRKLADAAQPLYASLSDEQKKRLPRLMHGWRG